LKNVVVNVVHSPIEVGARVGSPISHKRKIITKPAQQLRGQAVLQMVSFVVVDPTPYVVPSKSLIAIRKRVKLAPQHEGRSSSGSGSVGDLLDQILPHWTGGRGRGLTRGSPTVATRRVIAEYRGRRTTS